MASWSELLEAFQVEVSKGQAQPNWLDAQLKERLTAISTHRGDAAVIFYASAFLQKAVDNVSQRSWTQVSDLFGIQNEQEYDLAVERLNSLIDEVGYPRGRCIRSAS